MTITEIEDDETRATAAWTPGQDDVGVNEVTFTVIDSEGASDSQTVIIVVNDVNDFPDITSFTPEVYDLRIAEDASITFSVTASDIDGDELSYEWILDDQIVEGQETNEFTYNANLDELGNHTIDIVVSDGLLDTIYDGWILTVSTVPIANTFDGDTTNFEGLDDDALQNMVNVVLEMVDHGVINFGDNALDLRNAVDLDNYVMIDHGVIGINTEQLPAFSGAGASLTMRGLSYDSTPAIFMNAGFAAEGDTICPVDICSDVSYNSSTGVLTFNAAHFTTFFTSEAVNGEDNNTAPVANAGSDQTVIVSNQVTLDGSASSDPENDQLTYSWSQTSGTAVDLSSQTVVNPTFTPTQTGAYVFQLTVSDGNLQASDSVTITVIEQEKLAITDVDVKVDGRSSGRGLQDGNYISKDAEPESELEFDVTVKNFFPRNSDIEIEDIVITVTIDKIDEGDEIDAESNEFDLDPQEDDNQELTLQVPLLVEEGDYDVVIEVEGEDRNRNNYRDEITIKLEVRKEDDELIIRTASLSSAVLDCSRTARLDVEVINLGSDDQEEIRVKIENQQLGIVIDERDIELDEGDDEDSIFERFYTLNIDEDVAPGTYGISIKAYYDDDKLADQATVDLVIAACERVEDEEEEGARVTYLPDGGQASPTVEETPDTTFIIFDDSMKLAFLIAANIVMLGIIIFAIGYVAVVRRR